MKKFYFLIFLFTSLQSYPAQFSVFHTNDLHSSFDGNSFLRTGHYARLASAINQEKSKVHKGTFLLFDAGDFFSGSLLHTLAIRPELPYFPEYEFFDHMNFDAITLGNHEFDAGLAGLNIMFSKINKLGASIPIVSTNFNKSSNVVKKSIIKEIQTSSGRKIRVGVLGALGPDGCAVSRGTRGSISFIGYDDTSASDEWSKLIHLLKSEAIKLKAKGANVIVLLLHGGGEEDERLAHAIDEIDIVIAGHTHEAYFKKAHNTYIAQAGSNGNYLGHLRVDYNFNENKINRVQHTLIKINDQIEKQIDVAVKVKFYNGVNQKFLKSKFKKVSSVSFSSDEDLLKSNKFFNKLGQEITTGIAKSLKKKVPDFNVYFTSMSLIRESIYKGRKYTLKEIFNVLPIGFSEDLFPGATTYSFYVKLFELKRLIQFLEMYSRLDPKFTPAFSNGLSFQINKYGIPFINRINNLKIVDFKNLEEDSLIHIGTNSFIYKYLDYIRIKSFGFVDIVARDKDGNKLTKPFRYGPEYIEYAESKL